MKPEGRPASGADFDEALQVAERLLAGVDNGRHRVGVARVMQALLFLVSTLAVVAAAIFSTIAVTALVAIAVWIAACLAFVATHALLVAPLAARVLRDERAMIEIITVLRELHPHLAEREGWSSIRDRFARERISRFPIAERGRGITTFSGVAADVARRTTSAA